MKKLRRFFVILTVVLSTMLALSATGYFYVRHRMHQVPEWYHPFALDTETRNKAANQVDKALTQTYTLANAAHQNRRTAKSQGLPRTDLLIELTEDEMNAWVDKWEVMHHWKRQISNHVQDPILILRDHQLILAGKSKDLNDAIVSFHFEPRLENGKLVVPIVDMTVGTLPVPQWIWTKYVSKATGAIEHDLPGLQRRAEINPQGIANSEAVDAARAEFLLHLLRGEPSEPVLFIPQNIGRGSGSIIMQITKVDILNKTLSLQITPMDDDRREEYLHDLKGPEGVSIGMGQPAGPGK